MQLKRAKNTTAGQLLELKNASSTAEKRAKIVEYPGVGVRVRLIPN
jgi:hypothetical protein